MDETRTPAPTPRHGTIVAVVGRDDSHAAVLRRASALARDNGSTVILWARDADMSPLESPLPTDWSGDGEQEQFGDRLGPNDLVAAGREPIARQVGELRTAGIDAWAWLPESADAASLAAYAADQEASLVLVAADDAELLEGLQAAGRDGEVARTGKNEPRIETVPA